MHIDQVASQLRSMRLSVMADALVNRLKNGDARDLAPEEFFALLVQDEYNARQERKLSRMIGRANFKPQQACFENILYDATRGFAKKDLMFFTTSTWITEARNVIITGATGTGKSYLAEAIGLAACKQGYATIKYRCPVLFEEIQAAKGTGTYLKLLKKLARIPVLILDDFLMQPVSPHETAALLEIIEEKQMTGSIIATTQFPINKWHGRIPDPTMADALCDRLVHTAYKLNLEGDSMRKKKSQAK